MKQKHFIDIHKGITPLFILFLITYYNSWSNPTAMIYLALHGVYGILWISKSYIFPDKQWENQSSLIYGLIIWFGLSLYWISPYLITANIQLLPIIVNPPEFYYSLCICIYIIGIFLHFTSDMQKYISLKINPGHLITDHMFSRSRNTNYLGELCIYLGFTLLAKDYLPLIGLATIIIFVWIPNMLKKDKSLSRYSEFSDYKKKSKIFFPFFF